MAGTEKLIRRFSCQSCGGGLRYDIASGEMKCAQCGNLTPVSDLPAEEETEEIEVTDYHCPQCGAVLYSAEAEMSSYCSFCGTDVVLTGNMAKTQRPAKIVPFQITREQCEKAYRAHLRSHPLAPNELKTGKTISHFRPIYVPYWSYTLDVQGPVKIRGRTSQFKKEDKREYFIEETYNLDRNVEIHEEGIFFDASSAFEDKTAKWLQKKVHTTVPFHPAYLSGFYAHGPDEDPKTHYREITEDVAQSVLIRTWQTERMESADLITYFGSDTGLPRPQFHEELVLLPVWMLVHRQGRRIVSAAVNGQNGDMLCDMPIGIGKTAGILLGISAGLFALFQLGLKVSPDWMLMFFASLMLVIQLLFGKMQKRFNVLEPPAKGKPRVTETPSGLSVGKNETARGYAWKRFLLACCLALILLLGFEVVPGWLDRSRHSSAPAPYSNVYIADPEPGKNGSAAPESGGGESAAPAPAADHGADADSWDDYGDDPESGEAGSAAPASGDDYSTVLKLGLVGILIAMIVSLWNLSRTEAEMSVWPGLLACVAIWIGLLNLDQFPGTMSLYIVCPLTILAAAAAELVLFLRTNNRYASRPNPIYSRAEQTAANRP